jgi:ABC-type multidrug transport system fused ATPase/permease subunit
MNIYFRLIKYLLEHKLKIFIAVICLFFVAGLNVFSIAAFKPVIEILFGVAGEEQSNEKQILTTCPFGPPHAIYPLQTPAKDAESANVPTTLCPYGRPHPIEIIQPPPAQKDHLLDQLAADHGWAKPFHNLYAKAKAAKEQLQYTFKSYIQQGKKMLLLAIIGGVILVAQLLKFLFDFLSKYLSNYACLSVTWDSSPAKPPGT